MVVLAQLVRAPDCGSGGRRFEPGIPPKSPAIVGDFSFLLMANYVYILYSKSLKQFYKGQTNDLSDRLARHNAGYELATEPGRPWLLMWSVEKASRSEAVVLESKLKNLSADRLIKFMMKYAANVSSPDELLLLKQLSGC